ncbi:MAG: hypothetical protein Q8O00_06690 [Holophaga sp.]|nr:hypothetical protein [Holophaga sp.]
MRITHCIGVLLLFLLGSLPLQGGDLPPEFQARFIKILIKSANLPPKIICVDAPLVAELQKAGIEAAADVQIAWASNAADVKKYKAAGKLVICSQIALLSQGGSIAVIEEGGKPAIYLHKANLDASKVTMADSIFKIAKIVS